MNTAETLAPGARIVVRDAEWLVTRVDRTSTGGQAISATGISEIVKDRTVIFLDEIEKKIEVLDPALTRLVPDKSSSFQASLLYIESLLRSAPPTGSELFIGHRAAMDTVPYQLKPAFQALEQPRQRILIADAVGLGKTLEAGILMSELIRRGKGKRILVLTVKSMLTQFQKEMWCRFTIPLVRLDSVGIQRVRNRIPTNQNPFYYYDKSIISIDTLKQDTEYRTYIENAWWDIIVIDEAHNVAQRGNGSSLRARLASLLANKSDTLIMLSATPHDGRARSFASLMNMLDPTAIANPDDYGPEDIKGLYIRRFKKDIQYQVESAFREREIKTARAAASAAEEATFDMLTGLDFSRLDERRTGSHLFRITLEKALFSSPAACLATLKNRIKKLEKENNPEFAGDLDQLQNFARQVDRIGKAEFSKYQRLLQVITDKNKGFGWTGKDTDDRLVIFTERIETLKFLHENLTRDLKLKDAQVEILHGTMSDIEQQRVVEAFGRKDLPLRLLIASDVASEGINLHYLSHRMIHFDIPWSLMVFQQRNGRIDRYGQSQTPEIFYLLTDSENPMIKGDTRILELLIEKDRETVKNIGDPAEFMRVYDVDGEESLVAEAIGKGQTPEEFVSTLSQDREFDPLAILFGESEPEDLDRPVPTARHLSLFKDNFSYSQAAIEFMRSSTSIQASFDPKAKRIDLTAGDDLMQRFRYLPAEIAPEKGLLTLSEDVDLVQREIAGSRSEDSWPGIHYLWELNPVVGWLNDKLLAAFGRNEAPVLLLKNRLAHDECYFIMSGLIPNRKAHPLIHRWLGLRFVGGRFAGDCELSELIDRLELGRSSYPNPGHDFSCTELQKLLPAAVEKTRALMTASRKDFEKQINEKLNQHLEALERLRGKQVRQLELDFGGEGGAGRLSQNRKEEKRRRIDKLFGDYMQWIEDTMTTEDKPYIRVVAVLSGGVA